MFFWMKLVRLQNQSLWFQLVSSQREMDRFETKLRLFTASLKESVDCVCSSLCSLDSTSWWPLSVGPSDQVQDRSCLWVRGVHAGKADGQPALLQTRLGLQPETSQRNIHMSKTVWHTAHTTVDTATLYNPAAFYYFRWLSWSTTTVPIRPCSRCPPSSSIGMSCASELPGPWSTLFASGNPCPKKAFHSSSMELG